MRMCVCGWVWAWALCLGSRVAQVGAFGTVPQELWGSFGRASLQQTRAMTRCAQLLQRQQINAGMFAGCRRVAMQYDCCGDMALRQGYHRSKRSWSL